jgi:molybdopterin molybdotransferase
MTAEHETQRIVRLTPLDVVVDHICAAVRPVATREVDLAAALGRVLARSVVAGPRPAAVIALRDGWAVASDLTTDAGSYAPAPLPAAVRIDTGEVLPAGADAVAPVDAVAIRDGRAQALAPVTAGEGVLPAGADCDAHGTLIAAGCRIGTVETAVLAAAGIARVVVREPRIRLVRARPGRDDVIDAAYGAAARMIVAEGAALSDAVGAMDLPAALQDENADAVIVIGGTGSGRNDASVSTLARLGRVEMHGIALSPGETAAFGIVGARPVLLVPGRLDAALSVWLMLGRPLLARLAGGVVETPATRATLTRKVASSLGMTELVPVCCRDGKAEPIASGYWPLQAMARADGWILVAADSEGYPAGAEVVVRPWP